PHDHECRLAPGRGLEEAPAVERGIAHRGEPQLAARLGPYPIDPAVAAHHRLEGGTAAWFADRDSPDERHAQAERGGSQRPDPARDVADLTRPAVLERCQVHRAGSTVHAA